MIKNVAGYDLAKLFTGSFGTLGLIVKAAVRLHPAPTRTATLTARGSDPATLSSAARHLAALPLEADCLDVSWEGDEGRLDVRFGGPTASERAHAAAKHVDMPTEVEDDDGEIWARQRARQRGGRGREGRRVARPTSRPSSRAADGATVVSRAALGISLRAPAPTSPPSVTRSRRARARCSTAPTVWRIRGRTSIPARSR